MKTIKYCSKNDRCGTRQVQSDIEKNFPGIKQQRKGCLSECKTCRRQPFAKVGKKMIVADTPAQLYEQIVSLMNKQTGSPSKDQKPTATSRYWMTSKNELSIYMDTSTAKVWIKKLQKLQQSGKPRKLKATHINGSSTEATPILLKSSNTDQDRLKIKKDELTFHLSADAIEYALHKLNTFLAEHHLSPAEYYTFDRISSKSKSKLKSESARTQSIQVYFVTQMPETYQKAQ